MLPRAHVVHRTRERLRLRVPSRRDDEDFFDEVCAAIDALAEDLEVRVNATTGSVLLLHPQLASDDVDSLLREQGIFELTEEPAPPVRALEPLIAGVSNLDRAIAGFTSGAADLRTILFVVAVLLAVRQLIRGHVVGPAIPLLWMALELAGRVANSIQRESESEETD